MREVLDGAWDVRIQHVRGKCCRSWSAWKLEALEMWKRRQGPPMTVRSTVSNHQTDPRSIHILGGFVTSFWAILGSARLGVMFTVVGTRFDNPPVFQATYLISTVKEVTIQINLRTSTTYRVQKNNEAFWHIFFGQIGPIFSHTSFSMVTWAYLGHAVIAVEDWLCGPRTGALQHHGEGQFDVWHWWGRHPPDGWLPQEVPRKKQMLFLLDHELGEFEGLPLLAFFDDGKIQAQGALMTYGKCAHTYTIDIYV